MKPNYFFIFIILQVLLFSCSDNDSYTTIENDKTALGKSIFEDTNLSNPIGQACASCHASGTGFSDPLHRAISEGTIKNIFENINYSAISYNAFAPKQYYNSTDETFIGGLFLDGRSPDLENQLTHPFINTLEMNNSNIQEVLEKIKKADYYIQIESLYGKINSDDQLLSFVTDALVRFETSEEVNPFTSKYDYYIQGRATLSLEEKKGLVLFEGKALCSQCHVTDPDPSTRKILFTDFSYDNIGVPKNESNPFYNQSATANPDGANFIDLGIGRVVSKPEHNGKFKVPTLRNIAVSAPYFHNGAFKTLLEVVHFYNTRDLKTSEFNAPEVTENINKDELGNLQLTKEEELNLATFLNTLTDGYHKN